MGSALVALPVIKIKTITAEWKLMKRNRFSILSHASSWVVGIGVMVYCGAWIPTVSIGSIQVTNPIVVNNKDTGYDQSHLSIQINTH